MKDEEEEEMVFILHPSSFILSNRWICKIYMF
jgi:hypothetical protein